MNQALTQDFCKEGARLEGGPHPFFKDFTPPKGVFHVRKDPITPPKESVT